MPEVNTIPPLLFFLFPHTKGGGRANGWSGRGIFNISLAWYGMNEDRKNHHAADYRKNVLRYSQMDLSRITGIPRRTIEDYESGRRKTPDSYMIRLRQQADKDAEFMRQLKASIEADLDRRYPHGIASEVEKWE